MTPARTPSRLSIPHGSDQFERTAGDDLQDHQGMTTAKVNKRPACSTRRSCPQIQTSLIGNSSLLDSRLDDYGRLDTGWTDDFQRSHTLLQLQMEIHDSSTKIVDPHRTTDTSEPGGSEHRRQLGTLGRLFCVADKFIRLISDAGGPLSAPIPSTPCPVHLRSNAVTGEERSYSSLSNKAWVSSPALGSLGPDTSNEMLPTKPQFSDTTAFHLIMACHTRLLMAYDFIITTIAEELPNVSNLGQGHSTLTGSNFAIGAFTIQNGTFLESLLHLQVISHQLDHLSDALHHYLLVSRPFPRHKDLSSGSLSRTLYQTRWTSPPDTLGNLATGVIEEQVMTLKLNIAKIKGLARESHMF